MWLYLFVRLALCYSFHELSGLRFISVFVIITEYMVFITVNLQSRAVAIEFLFFACPIVSEFGVNTMQDPSAAVVVPVPGEHGAVQAPDQIAQPQVKRRRMSVKGPDPLQQVVPPQVAAVLPIGGLIWGDKTEESFKVSTNRQKYRFVYDRFHRWFERKDLDFVSSDASTCSRE